MKLRVARHTNNLKPIIHFYCDILGLSVLGSFEGHDGYDGVFIGETDLDWHLEFTTSAENPDHKNNEDDALVFYSPTKEEYELLKERFAHYHIPSVIAKNPYWGLYGTTYKDPDGFLIIITCK